ncbi:MAG: hypothetical protein KKF44_09010 [Nanoarchaeota archaeon]|nr:hypothetical protein [Nanoarchaeota archaeon]
MYDSRIKSNIAKFYLTALFASMQFSTPIAILFMQDIGLSLTQIMLLVH